MWPFPVNASTSLHPVYDDPVLNNYLAGHSWSTASKSVDNHSGAGFILRTRYNPTPMLLALRDYLQSSPILGLKKPRQYVFWKCYWFSIDINQISTLSELLNSLWGERWDFLVEGHLQHVMSKRSVDQGHDPEHVLYKYSVLVRKNLIAVVSESVHRQRTGLTS